jgi:5-hydroxyisourate hydrolase
MKGISTHVLDTARGTPARDLGVRLERNDTSGQWWVVGSARTGNDGRCSQLLPQGEALLPGIYRLSFDTGTYYATEGVESLYPVVQVTFSVAEAESHLHIPVLLSPFGYTTYRGS